MSYHLTYVEAVVTGLIQGVSELFPVSSLGHNVLIPALVGGSWSKTLDVTSDKSPYLAFIVGLHVATAIAMIAYFWRDWVRIVRGFISSIRSRSATTPDEKLAWMIILATIPVGIVGAGLQKVFTHVFAKPTFAALFLAVNGAILLYSERQKRRSAGGLAPAVAGAGAARPQRAARAARPGSAARPGVPVRPGEAARPGDVARPPAGGTRAGQRGGPRNGGWDDGWDDRRRDGGRDQGRDDQGRDDQGWDDQGGGDPGGGDPGWGDGRGGRPGPGYPWQPPQGYQQQPRQQQWQGPWSGDSGDDDWRYRQDGGGQQYGEEPWMGQPGRREQYGQDPRYSQEPQYGQDAWQRGEQYGQRGDRGAVGDPWADQDRWDGRRPRDPEMRRPRDPRDVPAERGGRGGRDQWAEPGARVPRGGHGQRGQRGHGQAAEGAAEADRAVAADRRLSTMGYKRAVLIGSSQIAALFAGISRDGIVTVAGLWRGLSREDAVRFSFLLSAPVILAAGLLKAPDLFGPLGKGIHGPVLVGSLLAGGGAYLSIRFLTRYFSEERSLNPFGIYCLVAGLGSLAYLLLVK